MKFQVTQDHIRRGRPKSPSCCPVALAIKDKLKAYVLVDGKIRIYNTRSPFENEYDTPNLVLEFMKLFDRGGARYLSELEFELPIEMNLNN